MTTSAVSCAPNTCSKRASKRPSGDITAEQLRAVEDKAITEIVKFQEDVGLKSITDGEFRRTYFHIDFLEQLGGVKTDIPVTIKKPDGTEELAPPVMRVIDKVRHAKNIQLADFEYLKSQVSAGHTPKVTIPSPTMLHFRGGRAGISKEAYPELDPVFYDDVAKAYGDELRSLAAAGCTYVQMDDTNLAYLCDEKMREARAPARRRPQRAAAPLRQVHQQGGGAEAAGHAAGHAPVPRQLQEHARRRRQLRAGGRGPAQGDEPGRVLHGVRRRPLGRLQAAALPAQGQDGGAGPGHHQVRRARRARTTSSAASTKRRSTRRMEQLALSPQCGFSSTVHGNNIAVEAQRNKLRLVVETAREVWGEN